MKGRYISVAKLQELLAILPAGLHLTAITQADTGNLAIVRLVGDDEYDYLGYIDVVEEETTLFEEGKIEP